MDWLKDKKNLPFVVGGAIALIVGSLTLMLYNLGVFNHSAALPPPPPEVAAAPTRPGPGGLSPAVAPRPVGPAPRGPQMAGRPHPGARPGPGGPGAAGAAATGAAPAPGPTVGAGPPLTINPATARDPFNIPIMKHGKMVASVALPTPVTPRPRPRGLLPVADYYSYASDTSSSYNVVQNTPQNGYPLPGLNNTGASPALPRVAGVIFDNSGVHAIIQYASAQGQVPGQASGDDQSRSVAPGDPIDNVGRVTAIDADGITVRTAAGSSLRIPVTAGTPETGTPAGGFAAPGGPGGPPTGFPPGAAPNPNGNF